MPDDIAHLRARVFNEPVSAPPPLSGLEEEQSKARQSAEYLARLAYRSRHQEEMEEHLADRLQPPLNPRQERFCLEYLRDPVGARAAAKAGYSPASAANQATRMLRKASVLQKIALLRDELRLAYRIDRDSLLDEIEEARELAIERGRPSAALRAIETKARLAGLLGRPVAMTRNDDESKKDAAAEAAPAPR